MQAQRGMGLTIHHISESPPAKLVHYALRALLAARAPSTSVECSTALNIPLRFEPPGSWSRVTARVRISSALCLCIRGEGGIRTLGSLLSYARLASGYLRPLWCCLHPSPLRGADLLQRHAPGRCKRVATGFNPALTRGCRARCAWREGGGCVARARAPFENART